MDLPIEIRLERAAIELQKKNPLLGRDRKRLLREANSRLAKYQKWRKRNGLPQYKMT